MNSVSLDSEMASALGDCKVGETKDITLRVKITGMKGGLQGTVESVVEYEEDEEMKDDEVGEGVVPPPKRAKALVDAIEA